MGGGRLAVYYDFVNDAGESIFAATKKQKGGIQNDSRSSRIQRPGRIAQQASRNALWKGA